MSSVGSYINLSANSKASPGEAERRHRRVERHAERGAEELSRVEQLLKDQDKAERRRIRREKYDQERLEWERYEEEKYRRRRERQERRGLGRFDSGGSGTASPVSIYSPYKSTRMGEDYMSVSDGKGGGYEETESEAAAEKLSLVSAYEGVHWAPLNIPLPRRLQTAAVLWHTLSMTICFSIFWFVLAIPLSWPLLVPYLVYVFFFTNSHADGSSPYKRSDFLRGLSIWRLYTEYFPIRLHRTVELDPTKNYIFAYHPHGIISHGAFGNFVTEATGFKQLFPGIKNTLLTLDSNFRIPFNREYLLALGLASVSKQSCEALLRGDGIPKKYARSLWKPTTWLFPEVEDVDTEDTGGRAITIVIGGAQESLEAQPGKMKLVCKRRRGFLKLAMREGAGVVPVLSFGENDLYEQVVAGKGSWIHGMQMAVKKTLGFTVPLIHARGVFNYDVGLMPYRHEINTVVGQPIFPSKTTLDPTDQEVAEFQKKYIDQLQRMWDEWKDVFAQDRIPGEEGEMEIIE